MIHGSCLCGGVSFEFTKAAGPFELCHCTRCRKVTGSAFFSGLYVRVEDFRLVEGRELITSYEAPILREPPRLSRVVLQPMRLAGAESGPRIREDSRAI